MVLIGCDTISATLRRQLKEKIQKDYLSLNIQPPTIAVVLVGNNSASEIYVRNKERECEKVDLSSINVGPVTKSMFLQYNSLFIILSVW